MVATTDQLHQIHLLLLPLPLLVTLLLLLPPLLSKHRPTNRGTKLTVDSLMTQTDTSYTKRLKEKHGSHGDHSRRISLKLREQLFSVHLSHTATHSSIHTNTNTDTSQQRSSINTSTTTCEYEDTNIRVIKVYTYTYTPALCTDTHTHTLSRRTRAHAALQSCTRPAIETSLILFFYTHFGRLVLR